MAAIYTPGRCAPARRTTDNPVLNRATLAAEIVAQTQAAYWAGTVSEETLYAATRAERAALYALLEGVTQDGSHRGGLGGRECDHIAGDCGVGSARTSDPGALVARCPRCGGPLWQGVCPRCKAEPGE